MLLLMNNNMIKIKNIFNKKKLYKKYSIVILFYTFLLGNILFFKFYLLSTITLDVYCNHVIKYINIILIVRNVK